MNKIIEWNHLLPLNHLYVLQQTESLSKLLQHQNNYHTNPYHEVFEQSFSQISELKFLLQIVFCIVI